MGKYLHIDLLFEGHCHFLWAEGKAWIEGAPFLEGAICVNSKFYVPAPQRLQEYLTDYASLARSQRRHWEKISLLNGLERKHELELLKRRKDSELKQKRALPWASETSKRGIYRLTGNDGIFRLFRKSDRCSRTKGVWFPNQYTSQIRCFVPASDSDIFE